MTLYTTPASCLNVKPESVFPIVRIETRHRPGEPLLRPKEVRPGQEDRGVELASPQVEHTVPAQPVLAGEAAVLLGESLGGHEDVLAGHEPEARETLWLDDY